MAASMGRDAIRRATARSRRRPGAVLPPAAVAAVAAAVAGCSNTTTTTYDVAQLMDGARRPIEASEGRVVAYRDVAIAARPTGAGMVVGAMTGAVLGPIGLVVGGGIGELVERWAGEGDGIEYLVAMDDGRMVTIVQERADSEEPLPGGTPVLVATGTLSSRVVRHPDAPENGAAAWADPDAVAAGAAAPPVDPSQRR